MFRIESFGKGFIAIMPHPGPQQGLAANIDEIARQGIRQLVSLLQPAEIAVLGLSAEAELVAARSMRFLSFPIADMGLPASVDDFASLSFRLFRQVDAGMNTLIHCRGGIGRSGLLAAAVLLHDGRSVQQAFAQVSRNRGRRVPETASQGHWLMANQAAVIEAAGAS
jgi:protein-tyrosine phosphatase